MPYWATIWPDFARNGTSLWQDGTFCVVDLPCSWPGKSSTHTLHFVTFMAIKKNNPLARAGKHPHMFDWNKILGEIYSPPTHSTGSIIVIIASFQKKKKKTSLVLHLELPYFCFFFISNNFSVWLDSDCGFRFAIQLFFICIMASQCCKEFLFCCFCHMSW